MKTKLVHTNFNPDTGVSTVAIQNKYGCFFGSSTLHEEDKEFASPYRGCSYAEAKAYIKYFKERVRDLKVKISALDVALTMIEQTKECEWIAPEARAVRKLKYIYLDEIEQWEERAAEMQDALLKQIEADDKLVRKIQADRNK